MTFEPKAEIRLHDRNLFNTVILVGPNLYREKFPLFIPSKDKIPVKRRQFLCMRRRQAEISGL